MSTLLISNQLTEETVEGEDALPAEYRQLLGAVAHRLIWLAREGDVVVLPSAPDEEFVSYVWRHLGVTQKPPAIVVPPIGARGGDLLYDERLRDAAFGADLRRLVAAHAIDRIQAFYFDDCVSWLARQLELGTGTPNFEFLTGGGAEIVNSKAFFRTLALGNAVPIPPGVVTDDRTAAEEFIWSQLSAGRSVIVKQDQHGGGYGNEILTATEGLDGLGANRTTPVQGRTALAQHLRERWNSYTYEGRRRAVIEHYLPDCVPIYIELSIEDESVSVVGFGEARMKPVLNGLVIPPPCAKLAAFPGFLTSAGRVGEALRGLGYRGHVSVDAIVTPDGRILFNEVNGRVSGSTHIHHIAERLVGPGYGHTRVLISRNRCGWPSMSEALSTLDEHRLTFDPATRTGVLIAGDDIGASKPCGQFLVVAETLEEAQSVEEALIKTFDLDDSYQ